MKVNYYPSLEFFKINICMKIPQIGERELELY